ncbi:bZIP transcription factor [Pseudoflavitalea sp. X16]|uniref:bZIP transcription factor n=1 Tax=Paraflavitalea devenefica TaxID=2716334 RepID=UPI00141F9390|nr:bZIP transcription factor [Paraflavitalea devenefica]NII26483.1 bZIP transcription factor [Paraflavitalea devenefica]
MKKSSVIFSALVAGAALFSSCNKNLKDDIRDLEKQVKELEDHNSELKEQIGDIKNSLGSDEPIEATTTFVDDNNVTRTIKDKYHFKAGNNQTQRLVQKSDGNYDIYIERFSDVMWYEGAWLAFTYNPATKEITNKRGGQYWDDEDAYYDNARYDYNLYQQGLTFNITLDSINLSTGAIALKFSATATGEYTGNAYSYYSPNPGKEMSTNFTFTGKLKLYPYEGE